MTSRQKQSAGLRHYARIRSQRGSARTAFGLILFAFIIGFAVAQHVGIDHEHDKLMAPMALPTLRPAIQSNPPAAGIQNDAPNNDSSPAAALIKLVPNSNQHVGQLARNFNLPDANGSLVSLSQYRGKVVIVNFWATWCGTCLDELPSLEGLYRDFRNRNDFALVTISVDQEGWSIIAPFLKRTAYDFPVLADADSRVSVAYGVTMLPTTYIVDRNGRIVWNVAGALEWSSTPLRAALEKLFAAA